MATTKKKEPAEGSKVQKVLREMQAARQESGLTLSDSQIEFIVNVVKACAG